MNKIPKYWPKTKTWPLPVNIKIVKIIETYPPIYVLSNGIKVTGVIH